jgi:hypothetical protein
MFNYQHTYFREANMLNLEEVERKLLQADNALTSDAHGEEVLRGLSPDESAFVMELEQAAAGSVSAADAEEYRQLRRRHIESRQMHNAKTRSPSS